MKINEIFYSIQGEGKWQGEANIFIRTSGCNLRCKYCDTKYAYNEGKELTIKQIFEKIKKFSCKKICITGGEPLLQKDIVEILEKLKNKGYHLSIETNGSVSIDRVKEFGLISLDIKCPSSNMENKMEFENIKKLTDEDQLKFVINDKKDYIYAKEIIEKYRPNCTIYFQPVWKSNIKNLAKWILEDNLKVKLSLQIHKIIWGEKKGV